MHWSTKFITYLEAFPDNEAPDGVTYEWYPARVIRLRQHFLISNCSVKKNEISILKQIKLTRVKISSKIKYLGST